MLPVFQLYPQTPCRAEIHIAIDELHVVDCMSVLWIMVDITLFQVDQSIRCLPRCLSAHYQDSTLSNTQVKYQSNSSITQSEHYPDSSRIGRKQFLSKQCSHPLGSSRISSQGDFTPRVRCACRTSVPNILSCVCRDWLDFSLAIVWPES